MTSHRDDRVEREHLEPGDRLIRPFTKHLRRIFGETQDPTFRHGLKLKTMDGPCRNQNYGRSGERRRRHLEAHLATTLLDHQDLPEVGMAMDTDGPIVNRTAR